MKYETIEFDIQDHVAWITLNRPKAYNAINLKAVEELCDVANRCGSDKSVRAAVLTGAGDKAFCAGGDVADFATNSARIELLVKEMTGALHTAISRFAWMRAPLIGAYNGVVAGGGLGLALACDLGIAAEHARFTSAYTHIGFTPDGSSTYFLSRLLGRRRAMEMFLTNRTLSAQEALDWGIVNRVVPGYELMAAAKTLALELARGPTRAHGGIKKLLNIAPTDSLESHMERETRAIADAASSRDGLEGPRAFVEKRKPQFIGE